MARLKGSKNKKGVSKFCSKGHEIALVGRTDSGNCVQCHQEYYRVRRDFLRQHFPKESL